ncbi:endopeptidase [Clostridium botulinum]|nr:phage tail spike protein [Clostridium botulinum]AWB30057.1 endopeptidase [Clostridium botulinum]MBY6923942.1 phage tail protein [Clostridium botulinum]MBY6940401.1 phage tail protein [Clostridium botulinum]MBY6961200.1 phage tail protein [Clostridium botulinum]MCR1164602.1 phage tail protein [Clostridium botulinum]
MITLYKEVETNFTHNGIGILKDCLQCELHREINGLFSLELEYPIFSKMGDKIEKHMIIKAPTPQGEQLFRIQERERDLSVIRVYATHIFFDLAKNFIADTNIVGKTRIQAVQQVLDKTLNSHKFTLEGEEGGKQNSCRLVRENPVEALIGDNDNTVRNRWGLELDFDNYKIIAKEKIGKDTGVLIAYRKNLLGIHETLDMKEVATRIIPQGYNELLLPEFYIDSPNIGAYFQPLVAHIKFEDIKVKEKNLEGEETLEDEDSEGFETKEEAYAEMRKQTQRLFSETKIDTPFFNYEVEFEELGKTEEYKQYKNLEKINLGDTVTIRHEELGLDLKGRMIAYDYDCLLKKYIKIEMGMRKKDLTLQIKQTVADIEFTKEKIEMEVSNLDKSLSSKLEITEKHIMTEVNDVNRSLNSKIEQTAETITFTVNNQISNVNSKIEQQADKINLVVDGGGSIKAAQIALAIANDSSSINMLADTINLIPNNGVINFSNGTSIDTRDSSGQNRDNFIRLRANRYCYVCADGNNEAISLFFSGGGGSHAYWTFKKDGLYKDGVKVL